MKRLYHSLQHRRRRNESPGGYRSDDNRNSRNQRPGGEYGKDFGFDVGLEGPSPPNLHDSYYRPPQSTSTTGDYTYLSDHPRLQHRTPTLLDLNPLSTSSSSASLKNPNSSLSSSLPSGSSSSSSNPYPFVPTASYHHAVDQYRHTIPYGQGNDDGRRRRFPMQNDVTTTIQEEDDDDKDEEEGLKTVRIQKGTSGDSDGVSGMNRNPLHKIPPQQRMAEPSMPDATYEEYYGDAYVAAPLKYIYPDGYQAMRPRSRPWQISLFICVAFTFLTVFIVGHCADRSQNYVKNYNNNKVDNDNENANVDDDVLVLQIRWCGSRILYTVWLLSVFITGLACAYVSIIGYIKARDFVVANSRSQPPGMSSGKSDYYVSIQEDVVTTNDDDPYQAVHDIFNPKDGTPKKTIFQADGTPQFWGGYIYKPTQAAVAVTHR